MKNFVALTLIAVCLGCFSLGCGGEKAKEPVKKDTTTTPAPADGAAAPAGGAAAPEAAK